jgi:hypothetical protein
MRTNPFYDAWLFLTGDPLVFLTEMLLAVSYILGFLVRPLRSRP